MDGQPNEGPQAAGRPPELHGPTDPNDPPLDGKRRLRRGRRVTVDRLREVTWWQALLGLAGTGLLVGGVVLLLGKVAGYAEVVNAIRGADPFWIIVAPVAEAFEVVGYIVAFRVAIAFGGGPVWPYWLATRLVFASLGATRLLAAAGAGGLAVVYWAVRRSGRSRHEAVRRVLTLNVGIFSVFGIVTAAAAAARLLGAAPEVPVAMAWVWLTAVVSCFALGILATTGRARRVLAFVSRHAVGRVVADAIRAIAVLGRMLRELRTSWPFLAGAALYWGADLVGLWAGLRAFDVEISTTALVLAYATGYVSVTLPLPAAGAGSVDAAMTAALVAVGVPLAPALLGVLVYRFCSFVLPTIPGLAALLTLPLTGAELRQLAVGPAASRRPSSLG